MPRKSDTVDTETTKDVLVPFNVIIDGQDRTILAKDQEDLQRKIALLRSPKVDVQ